jgi:hypothetical protein
LVSYQILSVGLGKDVTVGTNSFYTIRGGVRHRAGIKANYMEGAQAVAALKDQMEAKKESVEELFG